MNYPPKTKSSATLCPVCQQDNQCAVAAGGSIESCWCNGVTLDASVLKQADKTRCVCANCGKALERETIEGELK